MPRSAKEANNPILLKVQSLQLSFRPAGVSLGGGGGAKAPPAPPPAYAPDYTITPLETEPWCTPANLADLYTLKVTDHLVKHLHGLRETTRLRPWPVGGQAGRGGGSSLTNDGQTSLSKQR